MAYIRIVKLLVKLATLCLLCSCTFSRNTEMMPRHTLEEFPQEQLVSPFDVYDPIEPVNRGIYRFNYYFDTYLLLPVVRGYEAVTPDFVERRVSDFVDNTFEFTNLTNCLFQLDGHCSLRAAERIFLNFTVGIAGLWDPASSLGLEREQRDFGQTLGFYGAGGGPYLVMPFLGPSNLRDAIGFAADAGTIAAMMEIGFGESAEEAEMALTGINVIDRRHRSTSSYFSTGSPFEYELIRMLYTKYRTAGIRKLKQQDQAINR